MGTDYVCCSAVYHPLRFPSVLTFGAPPPPLLQESVLNGAPFEIMRVNGYCMIDFGYEMNGTMSGCTFCVALDAVGIVQLFHLSLMPRQ